MDHTFGLGGGFFSVWPQSWWSVLDQLPPAGLSELLRSGPEEGGTADRQAASHRAPPGRGLLPAEKQQS